MKKIKSFDSLSQLKKESAKLIAPRIKPCDCKEKHIMVCAGPGCIDSERIAQSLEQEIANSDIKDVKVCRT